MRTPFGYRAPQTAHALPELWVQSWRCRAEDSPHHSGLGIGLGSGHRVICFLNNTLSCSSALLSSLPRQTLLLNTASLNISGYELLPHVRSTPTWLPHVQVLCFLCVFSVFLQCGGKRGQSGDKRLAFHSRQTPAEGVRPLQADYRRETRIIIRVFAPFKNIISFPLI